MINEPVAGDLSAAHAKIQDRLGHYGRQLTSDNENHPQGRFEQRFHNLNGYRLFVPSSYDGSPIALIVMLHGCNQSASEFARSTAMNEIAEEQHFIVAYPEQSSFGNMTRTWHWFEPRHQVRGLVEPAMIVDIVADIERSYRIVHNQIFIAGFSSGAAQAVVMGVTYPDIFAAVGAHSGLPYAAARHLGAALNAMLYGAPDPTGEQMISVSSNPVKSTIVFHGDADLTVNHRNAGKIIACARGRVDYKETITHSLLDAHGRKAGYTRHASTCERGTVQFEQWDLHNVGHVWSGSSIAGGEAKTTTPDAGREMVRFFFSQAA
jgi:poly(hydroxyalkanoate) depolymerase family esterase